MKAFFTGGYGFALVLAVMGLEIVALGIHHRRSGRGIAPALFVGDLGAGMCLAAAAFVLVRGAPWPFAALALLGALVAHVFDLAQRWR